jgi:ABC-2 type transport system ATP-binding protein
MAAPASAAENDPLAGLKQGCAPRVSPAPKPVPHVLCSGTVESFDGTALDATLTLPQKAGRRPLPLIVFLHGFLAGKGEYLSETRGGTGEDRGDAAYKTVHWNNLWFASRGYAVLNYSARGQGESGGQVGLASKRIEVEDTRHLTGLLVDDRDSTDPLARIDRGSVGVLGSSYGGGQTWLLLTTRGAGAKRFGTWRSPAGRLVALDAAVPQYTWSDLLYALVPNGHQSTGSPIDPASANTPLGIGKQTLIDGFLATAGHKFTPEILGWLARLNLGEPYDDPGDPIVPEAKRALTEERSAFYQRDYFEALAAGRARRVPVFAAQGWTDPIFPALEALRMYEELRRADRRYPISLYLGDFEHLTAQVKVPEMRRFHDLATRMLDHRLRDRGKRPRPRVEAAVTDCDPEAFGPVLRARSWAKLSDRTREFEFPEPRSSASPLSDPRGPEVDPVVASQARGRGCLSTDLPPTSGIPTYVAPVGEDDLVMAGLPHLRFRFNTVASDLELNSRLWDVAPDGTQTLVDRGAYRSVGEAGGATAAYELFGNAWRFEAGHRIMLEITQDDSTFLRRDNFPSTATISDLTLSIPVAADGP